MQVKQFFSVPKELDFPKSNEDFFCINDKGNSCALSDGASESYDSKSWAKILCNNFSKQSKRKLIGRFFNTKQLRKLLNVSRSEFHNLFSNKTLSWSQQAAFKRGSFASLLGVIDHGRSLEILSIGDSLALWQSQNKTVNTHLLSEVAEFDKPPLLISTNKIEEELFLKKENLFRHSIKIKKNDIYDDSLYLMTDAIGKVILKFIKEKNISYALKILKTDEAEFKQWVISARSKKQIKTDDTTKIWIKTNETP